MIHHQFLFMSTHDPKTKTRQDKGGQTGLHNKSQEKHPDQSDKKGQAFEEGLSNNSNTQAGTANSGYDEKNPKRPGGKQQHEPKVTNRDNDITNSEEQNKLSEEPAGEDTGNSKERTDPEIDQPIPDSERTEKKIPKD